MLFHQSKAKFLRNRGEYQCRFHKRKRVSDALSRPAAKRKVRKSRQSLRQIAFPPLRQEIQRFVKPSRIAVHHPLRASNAVPRHQFDEPLNFLPERWEGDLAKRLPRF